MIKHLITKTTILLIGVIVFWIRRNIIKLKRFWSNEMKGWPKDDANYILYFEMVLMSLFLIMNGADHQLQILGAHHYANEAGIMGSFPISQFLLPLFDGLSISTLIIIERAAWWLHILGILFLGVQIAEYAYLAFGLSDGIYPSTFYLATGFHGFHVFVGTVFLIVCYFRARKGHFTPDAHIGFEAAAWYWHFVDVVWIFLYINVYWWGSAEFGHLLVN